MSEPKTTPSDKGGERDKKPLKNPEVDVNVTPKRNVSGNDPYVKKVKRSLEGDVKKAIDKAAPDGSKKQLESAEKATKDAATKIDPSKVDNVKVRVKGDVDGETVRKETAARPKKTD